MSQSPLTVQVGPFTAQYFTASAQVLTGTGNQALVSPKNTPIATSTFRNPENYNDGRLGAPYMWYFISDPNEATAGFFGVNVGLDHVISNFATGSCTRGNAGQSFDHRYTICNLTGFASQTMRFLITEDLLDYPTPGQVITNFARQFTLLGTSRYGVLLSYLVITSNPNDLEGRLDLAMPVGTARMNFYNTRCPSNNRPVHLTVTVPRQTPVPPPDRIPVSFRTEKGTNNWCFN